MHDRPPPPEIPSPADGISVLGSDGARKRHDFGAVVGEPGLTLTHAYPLLNESPEPLRIVRAVNMKPCCGDVHLDPTTLRPGEQTTLNVTIRVGDAIGPITHLAIVEVDRPGASPIEFVTTATAHPRIRIEEIGPSVATLMPGSEARRAFAVYSYGTEDRPPLPLDEMTAESPLAVSWDGPARDRALGGGLVERSRGVSALLVADDRLGPMAEEIRLTDGGTVALRHPIR